MAILIPLRKVAEDDGAALYDFFASDGGRGRLRIDKADGSVELVAGESDATVKEFTSSRAIRAARKLWTQGEYPAEADYRH